MLKTIHFMIKKKWAVKNNFSDLINFIANEIGETDLASHLDNTPKNATYLSPVTAEEFMRVLSNYIEDTILTSLKLAKHFVILADECEDEAGREQLAVFVRYMTIDTCDIKEDYIALVNLNASDNKSESRTAKGLLDSITSLFKAKGIHIGNVCFSAFDGTNTMSGSNSGLQRRIRHMAPHSIYINCRNHRLALVFVHVSKKHTCLQDLDALLISIWKMFHYSSIKASIFEYAQETHDEKPVKIVKAAATRWLTHKLACDRLIARYEILLNTLLPDCPLKTHQKAITYFTITFVHL